MARMLSALPLVLFTFGATAHAQQCDCDCECDVAPPPVRNEPGGQTSEAELKAVLGTGIALMVGSLVTTTAVLTQRSPTFVRVSRRRSVGPGAPPLRSRDFVSNAPVLLSAIPFALVGIVMVAAAGAELDARHRVELELAASSTGASAGVTLHF